MRHSPRIDDSSLLSGLFSAQVSQDLAQEQAKTAQAKAAKEAAEAAQKERERDLIGERLLADGFFRSEYELDHGSSIHARNHTKLPYPWNLPSRLFEWPAETHRGPDGMRRIGLLNPALMDHPTVKELLAKGYTVCSREECVNQHGVSIAHFNPGEWWHAVDLIKQYPHELLKTRQFTTTHAICGAVRYRLDYCHAKRGEDLKRIVLDMRRLLTSLAVPIPTGDELKRFTEPHECHDPESKKKPFWPINIQREADAGAVAWAYIHGIEHGWFQSDSGFLHWSVKGRIEWKEAHDDLR